MAEGRDIRIKELHVCTASLQYLDHGNGRAFAIVINIILIGDAQDQHLRAV